MAQSVRSTRRTAGAKKVKRALSSGQVHIFASFNNTIVTITDTEEIPLPGAARVQPALKAPVKVRRLLLGSPPNRR